MRVISIKNYSDDIRVIIQLMQYHNKVSSLPGDQRPNSYSLTGGYSRLRHRIVVPARQATYRLAGQYSSPMSESVIFPSQGLRILQQLRNPGTNSVTSP